MLSGYQRHHAGDQIPEVIATLEHLIVGKSDQIRLSLATLLAGGHLLLEDMPGVGKTTLARALAATIGFSWNRVQFTSDLLPADITGISIFDVATQEFRFHRGPVFTALLLADEINRAPPKTQSALLEAMEESQVTIDGQRHALEPPFFVVATQNPTEQLGVYRLPESQLDRFLCCIELGYPTAEAERVLLTGGDRRDLVEKTSAVVGVEAVIHWQHQARHIQVAAPVLDYVQALLGCSRQLAQEGVCSSGLSPRAGLSLLAMGRAWALIHGRDMTLPEDIQAVFSSVAAHRLTGSLKQGAPITREILASVDIP
jgi:MoxR-like ATPase